MKNVLKKELKFLRELWSGFRQARVLFTANNFRVFDHLKNPLSAKDLSEKIGTSPRATEILLDCLTGMGLLKKQGSRYQNKDIASRFLVSTSPYYQGNIIRHGETLWKNWSGLDQVLRTGKPFRAFRDHESFILGMHDIAKLRVRDVMRAINLRGVKKILDLGGGPGTYSMEFAKRDMDVTLMDYPETVKIARELIKKDGIKINFIEGDFMVDPIGNDYDLIFISQVLHAYSEKKNIQLLKKCRNSLNIAGRIVIQEFFISPDHTSPLSSALFSVNMLVNTEGGRTYSPVEIIRWLGNSGFKRFRTNRLEDTVIIEAVAS
ncbi:MAG: acetylserotonin O-methyltransferase [Thermodesulfovibrionales bacterium]|nr:acetylserotonin O-methyltransferase [Thermodesulfovibrionales bacterium]